MVSKLLELIDSSKIEIDSFKGKLRDHQITDLSLNLRKDHYVVSGDAELIGKTSPYINPSFNWGMTKIKPHKQPYKDGNDNLTWGNFITYGLNSKILDSKYFEGITKENCKRVHKKLLSTGIGKIDYTDFLNHTECTDIDFKMDFNMSSLKMKYNHNSVMEFLKDIERFSSHTSKRLYRSETNRGLKYHKRSLVHKGAKPFLKIYDKRAELFNRVDKTKGHFYKEHLSKFINIDDSPQMRLEITLKNKNHLDSLGLNNSLHSLLFLSMDKKREIVKKIIDKNMNVNTEIVEVQEKTLTTDKFLRFFFEMSKSGDIKKYSGSKYNADNIFKLFCVQYEIKGSSKTKLKTKLKKIGVLK